MSGIFWTKGSAGVKTFSSTSTAEGLSTVKVVITTRDPRELAYLLEQLAERRAEAAPKPRGAAVRPALAAPVLMIEDGRTRR